MTESQINAERLAKVQALTLKKGDHSPNPELAMCVMEAVAYIAGEPWADHPECACPVITEFMISWNDSLHSDEERTRLLTPLIPLIVGTRSTKEVEKRRGYMALDWLIRVSTPKWFDLVPALHEHAKALRELDAIADMAGATAAGKRVTSARVAAGKAARDAAEVAAGLAAWDAAEVAAWEAARVAAWDAAWKAARDAAEVAAGLAAGLAAWDAAEVAAWEAARVAAWDAAWDAAEVAAWEAARVAARDAAWEAAWDAAEVAAGLAAWDAARVAAGVATLDAVKDSLKPTTAWLQASAVELVKHMAEAA